MNNSKIENGIIKFRSSGSIHMERGGPTYLDFGQSACQTRKKPKNSLENPRFASKKTNENPSFSPENPTSCLGSPLLVREAFLWIGSRWSPQPKNIGD